MPQTRVQNTSAERSLTDVEVELIDAPIRVELTGTIGGVDDAVIRVGQLSIAYKDGRVIVRHKDLSINIWAPGAAGAFFAAGGHSASPVMVERSGPPRVAHVVAGTVVCDGAARASGHAATPSGDPPLVCTGPGGDYTRDYHG